jgi:maleylacetate reductase
MAALRGAELLATALDADPAQRDRTDLALASLLCAYALDSALFALHHVVCQTLVRICQIPHAETNAAMLPRTMNAMRDRAEGAIAALASAIGTTPGEIGERIEQLAGGPRRLGELGADRTLLGEVVDAVMQRPELQFTPTPPDRTEIERLLSDAW